MFDLRYYQKRLTDAALGQWLIHQSTAIIAATGTGKTEMYLSLAVAEPGRVLVLAHRDYLLMQPVSRLASVGFASVGVEKAEHRAQGNGRRPKIVFASVQTLGPKSQAERLEEFDPFDFSLLIVDEAHRATSPTYRNVLDHFKRNPKLKVLLVTATPNRKDGVALSNVCDSVAGVYGPSQAMADGWIVPVKFYRRNVQSLDFSNVRLKGTDLDPEQVQALLMEEKPLHEVCSTLADDRGPTIVFCPEVAIARVYETMMNDRYRPNRSKMLYAESSDEEREECGKRLANGDLDYLFNVGLYTEGYDLPHLLRVVWAAPTASLVRYTQGVGRVFRPHSCLKGRLAGTDSQDDIDRRRMLIEQSPKPFGIVVTYYPQNCKHELCDPVDILGGDDLPPDVKSAAKKIQDDTAQQSRGSSTEEDIETAKVFVDLFGALDKRRRELKAKATFADQQFDPMSGRKTHMGSKSPAEVREAAGKAAESWPRGDGATDKQLGWFRWKGVQDVANYGLTKFRAVVIRDLMEMGVKFTTAVGYGKAQALAVRDNMKYRTTRDEVPA